MDMTFENMGHGETYLKDLELGKKIMDVLEKHYAHHSWFVDCNHEAGHASIQLMYGGLDGKTHIWKYGYLLHIANLFGADLEPKIMRAGGEVLERYHMARSRVTQNDILNFKEHGIDTYEMVN